MVQTSIRMPVNFTDSLQNERRYVHGAWKQLTACMCCAAVWWSWVCTVELFKYLERSHADEIRQHRDDARSQTILSHETHLQLRYAYDLVSLDTVAVAVPVPARDVQQLLLWCHQAESVNTWDFRRVTPEHSEPMNGMGLVFCSYSKSGDQRWGC